MKFIYRLFKLFKLFIYIYIYTIIYFVYYVTFRTSFLKRLGLFKVSRYQLRNYPFLILCHFFIKTEFTYIRATKNRFATW